MTNNQSIKEFKPGDEIVDFFVIRKKELRAKKSDGSLYLALELGNATGRISSTIWEEVEERSSNYQVGDFVKVMGRVIDYKNSNTLVIEKIRKVQEEDQISVADFLPTSKQDISQLRKKLEECLQSIRNPHLQQLLNKIFGNKTFLSYFETIPAGKLWHHNRIAGLLEHTLSVTSLCDFIATQYPETDRDLLITGALLHDLGKIKSYRTDQGFIDYTDEGRLIGHLVIAANWINQITAEMPDFPEEYRKQLLHIIVSHHGELEKGSPVVPMTLEAIILFFADELDSKIDAVRRITDGEKTEGQRWSHFVRLLNRFLYFPPQQSSTDSLQNENGE